MLSSEIELPAVHDGDAIDAYFTQEEPRENRAPSRCAVIVLPDNAGYEAKTARSLADRLALFCLALVLVPDIHRGQAPLPAEMTPQQDRVALDVRTAAVYLRADHRVGPIALFGVGSGGSLVLRSLCVNAEAAGIDAAGGAAICPSAFNYDDLSHGLRAPTMMLFDPSIAREAEAAASARRLLANAGEPGGTASDTPHRVQEFHGLAARCGLMDESGPDENEDGAGGGDDESDSPSNAEDGLIMAEAWITLQLQRARTTD